MAKKRKLTDKERMALYSVFGKEVDYERVRIRRGNTFLFKQGVAFVINNKVHFHEDDYEEDFADNFVNMAWLSHEVCHIWQYQNLDYDWGDALEEHILYGDSVYYYKPDASKRFTDYRFEQQGAIIQDYYFGLFWPSPIQEVLEKIIYSTISKPDKSIEIPFFDTKQEFISYVSENGGPKNIALAKESIERIEHIK